MRVRDLKKALEKYDDSLIIVAKDTDDEKREVEDNGNDICELVEHFFTTEGVYVKQECLLIEP